jgi:Lytic transglycolase
MERANAVYARYRQRLPVGGTTSDDEHTRSARHDAKSKRDRRWQEHKIVNVQFGLAVALSCVPFFAHADAMVTSHYRAKAPHIAAHRTLPMGTQLIITNQRNGRSAHVVIRDRGPFIRGRSLDISHARAKALGFGRSGVLRLNTRVVAQR